MSARPAADRGLVAAAFARAGSFLLEPATPVEEPAAEALSARPVVLVHGLRPGCGASVVARALAAELATRDPGRAAAVAVPSGAGGTPVLGTQAATRLARTLPNLAETRPRSAGRLCVVEGAQSRELADAVRYLAPLVLDPGSGGLGEAAVAALADVVVLVGSPDVEPALAAGVAASLTDTAPPPLVVANRVVERCSLSERADLVLPESRLGARLALGGREPRAEFGRGIRALADRCEAV